jgi:hypothetical protein
MANSLKPCTFTFAGFQVDKKLAVSVSSLEEIYKEYVIHLVADISHRLHLRSGLV